MLKIQKKRKYNYNKLSKCYIVGDFEAETKVFTE